MQRLFFEDLSVGQTATMTRTVSEADITVFAAVSGDNNPVHLDEAFAQTTLFKGRIAHGMLSAAYISAVIGTQLPGPGAIYLSQAMKFRRPVRPGDQLRIEVDIVQLRNTVCRIKGVAKVDDVVVCEAEMAAVVRDR